MGFGVVLGQWGQETDVSGKREGGGVLEAMEVGHVDPSGSSERENSVHVTSIQINLMTPMLHNCLFVFISPAELMT